MRLDNIKFKTRAHPAKFRLRRAPLARSLRPRHRSFVNTSPFPTVWTSAPLVLRPSVPSARVLGRCLMILPPAPTRATARSTRASDSTAGSPPRFRSAMRLASWRLTRAASRRFRDSWRLHYLLSYFILSFQIMTIYVVRP